MNMKRKVYERPRTTLMCIEVENGFMSSSVYEKPENTEGLDIQDQRVQEDVFDFSSQDEWNY